MRRLLGHLLRQEPQPKLSGNYIFTGGISNLLDTDPQVSSDAGTAPGNGNTFPAFFDALGRYVFVNLGVSFLGRISSTDLASDKSERPGPSPGLFMPEMVQLARDRQ